MQTSFEQLRHVTNEAFRDEWVARKLQGLGERTPGARLLDVGAGLSRYRPAARDAGLDYRSHDFNSYDPAGGQPGLQNDSWDYAKHDFVCDILDIPSDARSDIVLCTEVLEHVPDPRGAFAKLVELTEPGGHIVVTVPFLSLMHQAPYWFSSGLSPFWFQHWSEELGVDVLELSVQGDYADLMAQEWARVLRELPGGFLLGRLAEKTDRAFRKVLPAGVLQAGGFGTIFVGRRR